MHFAPTQVSTPRIFQDLGHTDGVLCTVAHLMLSLDCRAGVPDEGANTGEQNGHRL